jgi:hypothetical protein
MIHSAYKILNKQITIKKLYKMINSAYKILNKQTTIKTAL